MTSERGRRVAEAKAAFEQLSPRERAAIGSRQDYEWDDPTTLPARDRPESMQFSIRVDRELYEGLQEIARRQDVNFSDAVRFALRNFVRKGGVTSGLSNVVVTFGRVPLLLQIPGQRAGVPSNRRTALADERIPTLIDEPPVTAASG
jgi:ribbon-helix-helix CopG family protein